MGVRFFFLNERFFPVVELKNNLMFTAKLNATYLCALDVYLVSHDVLDSPEDKEW